MQRFAFIVIGLSMVMAALLPSHPSKLKAPVENAVAATPASASNDAVSGGAEVYLDRDSSGHFNTSARLNGQSLDFLVDTGADMVALTVDDARRAGIAFNPSEFTVIASGASGAVRGQTVMIDRVEIAGKTIEHVEGAVVEGLGQNLLGQSVLAKIGGVSMSGNRMVLH